MLLQCNNVFSISDYDLGEAIGALRYTLLRKSLARTVAVIEIMQSS